MVRRRLSIFGFPYRPGPVNGIVFETLGCESAFLKGNDLANGTAPVGDREPLAFPNTTKNLAELGSQRPGVNDLAHSARPA